MRKHVTLIAGAAALLALPAFAGINPLDPGLPQGWTSSVYGQAVIGNATAGAAVDTKLSVVDSYHSAFCVECHGRNPSDKIQDPSGTFATTAMLGSHYVNNGGANAYGSTHTGGGFNPAGVVDVRNGGQYEKKTLWGVANQASKGLSKYGLTTSWQNNDIAAGAVTNTADGDVICESCHNVLVNRGDQLLLGGYTNDGTSTTVNTQALNGDQICVACHSGAALPANETYASFHPNGNLPRFNQTAGKRHHVLNGDIYLATRYNPDNNTSTNDSTMWAPGFSTELGSGATWTKSLDVVNGTTAFAFRGLVNATGQGTLATAATTGDISTGTNIMCVSCHRPHNAITTTGAFIFRQGSATVFASGQAPATAAGGVSRQFDVDATAANKIYGEYVPLCKGCHTGYGQ